ncbi:MAG: hypothetical protein PVG24_06465 [Gammaproteobacteria bacterium]|jgi:hypothetical protein
MKKIDFGQTVSALANIGVVGGLVFLGLEIRQNSQSLEASAYRELTNSIVDMNQRSMARPDLNFSDYSQSDYESLPIETQRQLNAEVFLRLRHADLAYHHYELGLLNTERRDSVIAPTRAGMCSWLFRSQWATFRVAFVASFQDFMDSVLSECRPLSDAE